RVCECVVLSRRARAPGTPAGRAGLSRVHESRVLPIRHQRAIDPERREIDDVRRALVIIGPGMSGADRQWTAWDEALAACTAVGRPLSLRARPPGKRERLRHRL